MYLTMPEHNASSSLSSASDEPLFEAARTLTDDAAAKSVVKRPAKFGRWTRCLLPALCVLMLLLLLVVCGGAAAVCIRCDAGLMRCRWSLAAAASESQGRAPLYTSLVIDTGRIPTCKTGPISYESIQLPCRNGTELITGGQERDHKPLLGYPIGPMVCRDDAFSQSGGSDNCKGNPFVLAFNGSAVVIPESGVYRVHSRVAFVDTLNYYVSTFIRIDPASCVADPACAASGEQRDSRAHDWLSCNGHNRPERRKNDPNRFTTCSIDGVRRFTRGDALSVHVTQAFRSINPFYKSTNLFIHKL